MISSHESHNTYEYSKYYKILPQINNRSQNKIQIKKGIRVLDGFSYRSNTNNEWMNKTELLKWVKKNHKLIGKI